MESITGFKETIDRMSRMAGADGKKEGLYDYRYDANKFCRKVFAQDAAFDLDTEVFWLDADSVTHTQVPESFLRGLIQGVPFAYYGRAKSYTETGFIGFNTAHEDFRKFREGYLSQFTEGKIFTQLKGWHDCIAFDLARRGLKGNDLSPNGTGMQHVMGAGPTSKYWHHLKGPRRKASANRS